MRERIFVQKNNKKRVIGDQCPDTKKAATCPPGRRFTFQYLSSIATRSFSE